jgi:hypothetical protein
MLTVLGTIDAFLSAHRRYGSVLVEGNGNGTLNGGPGFDIAVLETVGPQSRCSGRVAAISVS